MHGLDGQDSPWNSQSEVIKNKRGSFLPCDAIIVQYMLSSCVCLSVAALHHGAPTNYLAEKLMLTFV